MFIKMVVTWCESRLVFFRNFEMKKIAAAMREKRRLVIKCGVHSLHVFWPLAKFSIYALVSISFLKCLLSDF
jgi:hypothetical protein